MTGMDYSHMLNTCESVAHRVLFDEYYAYVFTVVLSKLCGFSREDVEECVSDVFAEVFCALSDNHRLDGDLKGFISTIAKRRAVDAYRRLLSGRRHMPVYLDDCGIDEMSSDMNLEENAERNQQADILLSCIESLGEPDSTIIIMKYYCGDTSKEIASSLGMKPSAVRMRCSRALGRLKNVLKDKL